MARRVVIPLPAASGALAANQGCLLMHATRETTGTAPAVYKLFDGSSANGELLLPVALSSGQSTRDNWWRCVMPFRQGLFYQLVSGTLEGSVAVLLDHPCDNYWHDVERQAIDAIRAGI